MMLEETLVAVPPPLEFKENGRVIRVRGTRIPLDTVIYAYNDGESVEAIVESYSTLNPADVHAVISYYLRHKADVDAYIKHREQEAEVLRREIEERWPSEGIKERLLARQRQEKG